MSLEKSDLEIISHIIFACQPTVLDNREKAFEFSSFMSAIWTLEGLGGKATHLICSEGQKRRLINSVFPGRDPNEVRGFEIPGTALYDRKRRLISQNRFLEILIDNSFDSRILFIDVNKLRAKQYQCTEDYTVCEFIFLDCIEPSSPTNDRNAMEKE